MFALKLGEVETDEAFLQIVLVDVGGELFGELGFADSGGAKEEEDEGFVLVVPAIFAAADGRGHCEF